MEGEDEKSSPFLSDYVYEWLDSALDWGIGEADFWDMTLDELTRLMKSKNRVRRLELQERAKLDYALADLIGKSISRLYSSSSKLPDFKDAYSFLFDEREKEEIIEKETKHQDELSALRFKQFAESFNAKFKKEVAKD